MTWYGRNSSGRLVKTGTYHFRVRLMQYGTTHYGGRARITVNSASCPKPSRSTLTQPGFSIYSDSHSRSHSRQAIPFRQPNRSAVFKTGRPW